jgi:hypothetical protein
MDLLLTFNNSTRITLFDGETFGSDDNLGSTQIFANEAAGVEHTKDIAGPGSLYRLTYRVRIVDV